MVRKAVTNPTGAALAVGSALAMLLAAPAGAHHSFASEFDGTREITVSGVLTQVSWTNPHIEYEVRAVNKAGKVVLWSAAGLGPTVLHRAGVVKADLRVGSTVKVTGFPAKDGTPHLYSRVVEYADGAKVMTGLNREKAGPNE